MTRCVVGICEFLSSLWVPDFGAAWLGGWGCAALTVHGRADLLVVEEGARLLVRGGLHKDDGVPVVSLRERGRVGGLGGVATG